MADASETFSFLARPIEARVWQIAKGISAVWDLPDAKSLSDFPEERVPYGISLHL